MNPTRPLVLVIDDEESMRFFLRRALSRRGFSVAAAADGEDGLRRFREQRPDAVLLDVRLPGLGGRDVLESIRAQDTEVPVVMMTGYATVDDATGAMWAGATDYVRKPLRADEVAATLHRVLEARHAVAVGAPTVRRLTPVSSGGTARGGQRHDPAAWLSRESGARTLPEAGGEEELSLHDAVRQFERIWVDELLRRSGGNVARAARAAGISRPNLHRKMRSLGLSAETYRRGNRP